jgi:hypothetical protein
MQAIGADHDIGGGRRPVSEGQGHVIRPTPDGDAARAQANARLGNRRGQHRDQIGPVRGVGVLPVEPFAVGPEPLREQHPAVLPAAELPAHLQRRGQAPELLHQAQPAQQPRGIRGHPQARADLGEHGGLLVDRHVQAGAVQEPGRGQPPDPSAHDRDARIPGVLHPRS